MIRLVTSNSLRASFSLPICKALTAASFMCSALKVNRQCLFSHMAAAMTGVDSESVLVCR